MDVSLVELHTMPV